MNFYGRDFLKLLDYTEEEILYLIHRVQATWSCGIIAVWLLSVALLMHRYYRFKIKKYAYSLIWFIEKYESTTVVNEQ